VNDSNTFTPGPWQIEWEQCECGGEYSCEHGQYPVYIVAPTKQVERYPASQPGATFPAVIANMSEACEGLHGDARLIAAAPDLIKAAKADLYAFDRIVALVNEARDGTCNIDSALDLIMDFASMPAAREILAKAGQS
jgi:hypothetical protein